MEFNNFYKLMRKSPQYDKILESKENDFMLRLLTSREVFAIFYSNDLYDNKYTLCQILKLYNNTKLKRLVKDSLMERIKAQHKKKNLRRRRRKRRSCLGTNASWS